jgi:hypothetical protein
MRPVFVIFLLFSFAVLRAQTDSTEKAVLYNKLVSNEINQQEFSSKLRDWNQKLKDRQGYPGLPVDANGQIHFFLLRDFGTQPAAFLFNRTLEWLSVNYGLVPSSVYASKEDGKIIFRNTITLKNGFGCTYTSVITIGTGKILNEFFNISYQRPVESEGETYYESFTINQVYPVITKPKAEWDRYLQLLRLTGSFFPGEADNLDLYIDTYKETYGFLFSPDQK